MTKKKKATVLPPDMTLKNKLANRKLDELVDAHKFRKAEESVKKYQVLFHVQVEEDAQKLKEYAEQVAQQQGQDPVANRSLGDAAYRLSILCGTFHYTLAATVAKQLHKYLDTRSELDQHGLTVVQAYVSSLRSIFKHDIYGDGGETGKELLASLTTLVHK